MPINILIIGSGGREHALAWKLAQSPRIGKLYVAPGNGGTQQVAENVAIDATAIDELVHFAEKNNIGLTVVGPDDPLARGVVDAFQTRGLRIFGPTQAVAKIESSKAFAKNLMHDAGIATAAFKIFSDYAAARAYIHAILKRCHSLQREGVSRATATKILHLKQVGKI